MAGICAFGVLLAYPIPSDSSEASVQPSRNGAPFHNGGIAQQETRRVQGDDEPYNLRVTFSEGEDNAYVTGLTLKITDAAGQQVFALDDAGPLTEVALPPGRYHVKADFGGVSSERSVTLRRDRPVQLDLHWSIDDTALS